MVPLKRISAEGVPAAMAKAERYRLLNQPWAAESICEDVLAVVPGNQDAVVLLLLSITDQLAHDAGPAVARAREALGRLTDPYRQAYYGGVIAERRATATLHAGGPGSGDLAWRLLQEAMAAYERAESLRVPGHDESILRWNTCQRLLERHPELAPRPAEEGVVVGGE
jgi:hypothetical protein